jgi:hypothetical protein
VKKIAIIVAAVLLSACSKGIPVAKANKVQQFCAEIGLVSRTASGGKENEVASVTCSAEGDISQ